MPSVAIAQPPLLWPLRYFLSFSLHIDSLSADHPHMRLQTVFPRRICHSPMLNNTSDAGGCKEGIGRGMMYLALLEEPVGNVKRRYKSLRQLLFQFVYICSCAQRTSFCCNMYAFCGHLFWCQLLIMVGMLFHCRLYDLQFVITMLLTLEQSAVVHQFRNDEVGFGNC